MRRFFGKKTEKATRDSFLTFSEKDEVRKWNERMDRLAQLGLPESTTDKELEDAEAKEREEALEFYREKYNLPQTATLTDVHTASTAEARQRSLETDEERSAREANELLFNRVYFGVPDATKEDILALRVKEIQSERIKTALGLGEEVVRSRAIHMQVTRLKIQEMQGNRNPEKM